MELLTQTLAGIVTVAVMLRSSLSMAYVDATNHDSASHMRHPWVELCGRCFVEIRRAIHDNNPV